MMLGKICLQVNGTSQHEFMHALGFGHEQSRYATFNLFERDRIAISLAVSLPTKTKALQTDGRTDGWTERHTLT